jgi:serine/threonine-protein kinase RsbW
VTRPSGHRGTSLGTTSVAPDLASLSHVRHFIQNVADAAHLTDDQSFDLKVAVSEASANAIEHATRRAGNIDLEAWLEGDRLTISIVSQSSFHHRPGMEADQRRHRGFGLPLMVALTDEVCISRTEGGVRVDLSLYLDQP